MLGIVDKKHLGLFCIAVFLPLIGILAFSIGVSYKIAFGILAIPPFLILIIFRPVYGVLSLACLYPLIYIGKAQIGYTVFMYSFRLILLATIAGWIAAVALKRVSFSLYGLELYLLMLLSGSLFASISGGEFTSASPEAVRFYKYLMYSTILVMIPKLLESPSRAGQFLLVIAASTSIVSILAIVQYFTGMELVYDVDPQYIGLSPSLRLFVGIETNPNSVAVVQLLSLGAVTSFLVHGRHHPFWSGLVPLIIMTFILMASLVLGQSRSAVLALVCSIFIVPFLTRRTRVRTLAALTSLLLVICCLYFVWSEYVIEDRFYFQGMVDHSRFRVEQTWATILLALNHPLGVGDEYSHLIGTYGGIPYASTHNLFLRILADIGFIGFLGYLGILYRCFLILVKHIRASLAIGQFAVTAALLTAFFSILLHSLVHHIAWEYPLWFILGLSLFFKEAMPNSKRLSPNEFELKGT